MGLRPNRSAREPKASWLTASVQTKALSVNCAWSVVARKSRFMDDIAGKLMSMPKATTAVIIASMKMKCHEPGTYVFAGFNNVTLCPQFTGAPP